MVPIIKPLGDICLCSNHKVILKLSLNEKSKELTTISTHKGLYIYNRVPFNISRNIFK